MVDRTRWYVLRCEVQCDLQVARLIEKQGLATFAPRIPRTRKRNGEKPLFPGYVFVRLDLPIGRWNAVRRLPGVRYLVEIGGGPCPIDDGIVERIRHQVASYVSAGASPRMGDRVTVTSGAFAEFDGVVCEMLSGDERVAILIDMMRRQVRVEMNLDKIVLVERPGVAA